MQHLSYIVPASGSIKISSIKLVINHMKELCHWGKEPRLTRYLAGTRLTSCTLNLEFIVQLTRDIVIYIFISCFD